jgi:hypothetical protein
VTIHKVCEIIAIDAPVEVSPPYAAGKTTVFKPNGVPKAKNAIIIAVSSAPRTISNAINKAGKTISLKALAK